jgi:hypothetical protein
VRSRRTDMDGSDGRASWGASGGPGGAGGRGGGLAGEGSDRRPQVRVVRRGGSASAPEAQAEPTNLMIQRIKNPGERARRNGVCHGGST